jgi:hypothetical protein
MWQIWQPRTRDGATLQVFLTAYRELSLANLMGIVSITLQDIENQITKHSL